MMADAVADPVSCESQIVDSEIGFYSRNVQLVPDDVLSKICRGPLKEFVRSCQDEKQIKCMWESLFLTFSTRSVPKGQTQAACNALILFLDNATSSDCNATQRLANSHKTWLAVFEAVLIRFEDATPRPMKQVLSGLFKILKRHPDVDESRLIQAGLVDYIMPSIILGNPKSRLKSSLISLERLVRDSGLPTSRLMSLTYDWLVSHYENWHPLFVEHCQSLSVDTTPFIQTDVKYDDLDAPVKSTIPIIFNLALLVHANSNGCTQIAGSLMAHLYMKAVKEEGSLLQSTHPTKSWALPTKHVMLQMIDSLELFSRSLLHPLLECDIKGFRAFIRELPLDSVLSGNMVSGGTIDDFKLLFSTLEIGKRIGFVHEDHIEKMKGASKDISDVLVLKSEILGRFLLHSESRIRLQTLSLLITAPMTSKPISAIALKAILESLPSLHAESDSRFRQDTASLIKRLMLRLRGPSAQKDFMEKEGKDAYLFMKNYVDFLNDELIPTASYQRHISALTSISLVLNTGVDPNATHVSQDEQLLWRYKVHVLRPDLFRLLTDLLLDPFEEVRGSALHLIGLFPRALSIQVGNELVAGGFNVQERLITALSRAEVLASRTSRADHADTVARLYHALYCMAEAGNDTPGGGLWFSTKVGVVNEILQGLEAKLFTGIGFSNTSIRDAPLHGHTSALRYIVSTPKFYSTISVSSDQNYSSWRTVHDRILKVCQSIWAQVKPVLCVDTPEGNTEELTDDFMLGPKDLLSYSWRALKESSLLFHAIADNTSYAPQAQRIGLQRADYEAIGTLSFTQLSELRHRGAFTAVSQTFATCCMRCAENEDAEISALPDMWYQDSLKIIQNQASKLTRRSAGLPAMVTGICIAKSGSTLFEKIMSDLQEISSSPAVQAASYNELSLPQVHAMNCLKDILINTKLVSSTEKYIMPILRLAADSLSSPIWAIRNCGLMLFHALMNRMCKRLPGIPFGFGGPSGTEPNMTLSFERYTGLTQLLAQLLTSVPEVRSSSDDSTSTSGSAISNETEKVFPALEIITEKVPSMTDDDDALLRGLVLRHVNSTIWAIRDQAARVYASLLHANDMLSSLGALLDCNPASLSQIHLHGKLLCVRFTLLRVWHSDYWRDNHDEILASVRKAFQDFFPYVRSPFAQATLFDLLSDALESNSKRDQAVITKITSFTSQMIDTYALERGLAELVNTGPQSQDRISAMRAESLLRRSLAWCFILTNSLSMTLADIDLTPAGLMGPFFDLAASDSDAACWILERVRTIFPGNDRQKELLSLYLLILLQGFHEEDVKAKAALNLTEILEDALERNIEVAFINKWARVSDHLFIQSQENMWSRELTENVLRLQGSLLALKYKNQKNTEMVQSNADVDSLALRRWAISLRSALSEETVFSARCSAIMSMKTFSRTLRNANQPADTTPASLELYLILYDMLNDDDDELRALSAPIASWVLSYSTIFPNQTVALGAVPASESLAQFIATNYATEPGLFHHVVKRLMGQALCHQQNRQQLKSDFIPFKVLFEEYNKESTVLFEEERQNLFIDDVKEIDTWTKVVLKQMDKSVYDRATLKKLTTWVSDGLQHLSNELLSSNDKQEEAVDDVLGWTSKPEVYTLGTLLFNMAGVLISFSAKSATEPRTTVPAETANDTTSSIFLRESLKTLYAKGKAALLHSHWLDNIQAAISIGEKDRPVL